MSTSISSVQARALWLHAQRLDVSKPFGSGSAAVQRAVEHLGYVQIDTINVIQRSHHQILYCRIPDYQPAHLERAQSVDKSVFEYWAHALAYLPTTDYRLFIASMDEFRAAPRASFTALQDGSYKALLRRIRDEGPLSIRDFDDEVLIEKTHPWGSRKPSRGVLRYGFFSGDLTVSKRTGMVKSYELSARHFGWTRRPQRASELHFARYLLQRALRAQGIVSLDSICFGNLSFKAAVAALIEAAVKRKRLLPVHLEGHPQVRHWIEPMMMQTAAELPANRAVHILSPFDPLTIQRKRLKLFFDYDHRFEAYVPAAKRVLGYFALPVLVGDEIVAAIDLKMDRKTDKLLMQKWTWMVGKRPALKRVIEEALDTFERFQKL
ncbi:MAG: winged helix-turn-helix domain-containing protein [Janthinobacterium lividum]